MPSTLSARHFTSNPVFVSSLRIETFPEDRNLRLPSSENVTDLCRHAGEHGPYPRLNNHNISVVGLPICKRHGIATVWLTSATVDRPGVGGLDRSWLQYHLVYDAAKSHGRRLRRLIDAVQFVAHQS